MTEAEALLKHSMKLKKFTIYERRFKNVNGICRHHDRVDAACSYHPDLASKRYDCMKKGKSRSRMRILEQMAQSKTRVRDLKKAKTYQKQDYDGCQSEGVGGSRPVSIGRCS